MRSDYIAPVLSGLSSLQGYAQQWYLGKALAWPKQPAVDKIDIHHHMVPDFYATGNATRPLPFPSRLCSSCR